MSEETPPRPIEYTVKSYQLGPKPEPKPVAGSTSANRYLDELKAEAEKK